VLHVYRFGLLMVGLMLLVSGCGVPSTVQALSPARAETPLAPALATPAPVETGRVHTPAASAEAQAAGTPAGQEPSEEQLKLLASLKSLGAAPELSGGAWLNSEPLKLGDLKGKVVLVEFWTFGCINCQHVIPAVRG